MISPLRFGRRPCSRWAGSRQLGMPAVFLDTRSAIRNRRSVTRPLQAWPHADDFGWEAQADVHVFEYASVSEVDAEAARVSADGSTVGTTQISRVSTPHFFRGNRLIVLYVGTDDRIIQMLASLLGPQFAGR